MCSFQDMIAWLFHSVSRPMMDYYTYRYFTDTKSKWEVAITLYETTHYLYLSTCHLFTIPPDLQSCFSFPHQLFDKLDHILWYSDPFIHPYHPIMADFVVCLFVVIKGYCQVAMMLLDLLHDASVDDELIYCVQYAFHSSQFSFVLYFIHCSVLSHVFRQQARQDLL